MDARDDRRRLPALIARRELHGLVLTMSTENFQSICTRDLWMRFIIAFFAGISALGVGLSWRNTSKTSELQIRLIRASELNSHLKEMNLAAAGLAHETRNPLNIIRGMAQMLSKQAEAPTEIREKARAIVDETDKVTVQLNEFINYSRPREVRRAGVVDEFVQLHGDLVGLVHDGAGLVADFHRRLGLLGKHLRHAADDVERVARLVREAGGGEVHFLEVRVQFARADEA